MRPRRRGGGVVAFRSGAWTRLRARLAIVETAPLGLEAAALARRLEAGGPARADAVARLKKRLLRILAGGARLDHRGGRYHRLKTEIARAVDGERRAP